jgi:hypothetical protein
MRVALRHLRRRVTKETADQEQRHPSRGEDRSVAMPEVVPLDAPETGASLRRPEHPWNCPGRSIEPPSAQKISTGVVWSRVAPLA